jgi:hypothetical protein
MHKEWIVVFAYKAGSSIAYNTFATFAPTKLQALAHFRERAEQGDVLLSSWTRVVDILDGESAMFDRKASESASETCKHCGQKIQVTGGYYPPIWVDSTDGDGCLQITQYNQTHEPASEVKS